MALYIVAKTGPAQGETYSVSEGLTIGRKGAAVHLSDSKVSSRHAQIKRRTDGVLQLVDLGSKNGIFSSGERVSRIDLSPGVEFEVGTSTFVVFESQEGTQKKKAEKGKKRWNEILSSFARKSLFQLENDTVNLTPMRPALVLDFLRGPQVETRWILGYGPRKIGRLSVDLPIFEEKASEVCFEVFPSNEGICFKSLGEEVRLNGKKVSSEVLKVGDRIQILNTELEVDFIE